MENVTTQNTGPQNSQLSLLTQARKALVLLKEEPSFDEMVSTLALGSFLESNGKQVRMVCPSVPEYLKSIEGVEKIENNLGTPTLVISFDYIEGDIEKISYKVEEDKFNLVINSRGGLDPKKLNFTSKAVDFDIVLFVGVHSGEEAKFGELYTTLSQAENLTAKSIYLSRQNGRSLSEQLVSFFMESTLRVDSKAAEWLFSGIKSAMSNFADPTSASAFEAAAQCVRWIKNEPSGDAPESWLAPKIYKGSTAVD